MLRYSKKSSKKKSPYATDHGPPFANKPNTEGGLGITNLEVINKDMLIKTATLASGCPNGPPCPDARASTSMHGVPAVAAASGSHCNIHNTPDLLLNILIKQLQHIYENS
jgi:hypothetical protein